MRTPTHYTHDAHDARRASSESHALVRLGARCWPALRATLIAFALIVQALLAVPNRILQERDIARAEYEDFIVGVEHVLHGLGAERDRSTLNTSLMRTNAAIVEIRNELLAPVEPLFRLLGNDQQWSLFLSANRDCYRLVLDGQDAGTAEYHTLYRALELDAAGLAPLLTYRRVRALYNAGEQHGPSRAYDGLASHVSRELFGSYPDLSRVRLRIEHLRVGDVGEPLESMGLQYELVRTRATP